MFLAVCQNTADLQHWSYDQVLRDLHCCSCFCVLTEPVALSQLIILLPDAAGERAALHRQRSLPHRPPVIPLVARMADQNTSGTPAMTEREASRLDKFKQLLAGPNTDLGKTSINIRPPCMRVKMFAVLQSLFLSCYQGAPSFTQKLRLFIISLICSASSSSLAHSLSQLRCTFNNALSG